MKAEVEYCCCLVCLRVVVSVFSLYILLKLDTLTVSSKITSSCGLLSAVVHTLYAFVSVIRCMLTPGRHMTASVQCKNSR